LPNPNVAQIQQIVFNSTAGLAADGTANPVQGYFQIATGNV